MTKFSEGDRVVLEHEDGSKLVRTVEYYTKHAVRSEGPSLVVATPPLGAFVKLQRLLDEGWRVTSHTPKVTLPTEPGYYIDKDGVPWRVEGDERRRIFRGRGWFYDTDHSGTSVPEQYAPFTLLIPESELERDGRIQAWEQVAKHPALRQCYEEERALIAAFIDRLNDLHSLEQTVSELAPAPTESEVSARVKDGQREVVDWLYTLADYRHNRDAVYLTIEAGRHFGLDEDGAE